VTALKRQYLREMGISSWRLRDAQAPAEPDAGPRADAAGPGTSRPEPDAGAAGRLAALAATVSGCTRCTLHRSRTQTVFGVGRADADLMVIGEAPGADEDRQGEPFVGRAGQLLNAMLEAIRLPRDEVYIANILKCRPPNNRDPKPDEVASCTPYLNEQIAIVRPRAILAVGRIAAQELLQSDHAIGRLRGRIYEYAATGTPLVVTYHPAYLLRSPQAKAKAWDDLCRLRALIVEHH
jgi:uracil-DNA glycosylase family 4